MKQAYLIINRLEFNYTPLIDGLTGLYSYSLNTFICLKRIINGQIKHVYIDHSQCEIGFKIK